MQRQRALRQGRRALRQLVGMKAATRRVKPACASSRARVFGAWLGWLQGAQKS